MGLVVVVVGIVVVVIVVVGTTQLPSSPTCNPLLHVSHVRALLHAVHCDSAHATPSRVISSQTSGAWQRKSTAMPYVLEYTSRCLHAHHARNGNDRKRNVTESSNEA